jgi:hypothetical protein
MTFTYKTSTSKISKIEFTSSPDVANIAFVDGGSAPTVLIFGVPAAIASAISVNFTQQAIPSPRDLTIYVDAAPAKKGANTYAEANYAGRAEIS